MMGLHPKALKLAQYSTKRLSRVCVEEAQHHVLTAIL